MVQVFRADDIGAATAKSLTVPAGVQVDTYLSCVILAESVGSLWGNFVRDYLVEQYENLLSLRITAISGGGKEPV